MSENSSGTAGGRLAGKVAIITGAATGMGAEYAAQFVAQGARVVVADITEDVGADVAEKLGENARFVRLDVTDGDQWRAAVEETTSAFGPPTVLVNNAGITGFATIIDEPVEDFRRMLDVNLVGTWLGIQAVVPSMSGAGGGSIVNISSDAGMKGYANLSAYIASKWAVRGLTRSAAVELGPSGIRVNTVLPGFIDTAMGRSVLGDTDPSVFTDRYPISRLGRPEEVAGLVVFLASDEASYCTGADYLADGGQIAGETLRA